MIKKINVIIYVHVVLKLFMPVYMYMCTYSDIETYILKCRIMLVLLVYPHVPVRRSERGGDIIKQNLETKLWICRLSGTWSFHKQTILCYINTVNVAHTISPSQDKILKI